MFIADRHDVVGTQVVLMNWDRAGAGCQTVMLHMLAGGVPIREADPMLI